MKGNKYIDRDKAEATKMYDNRSLEVDYRTLIPILKEGMSVLDIGCGTGAISKDIANIVGETGNVVGIDNTANIIESGKETYKEVKNLELKHIDLFDFESEEKFDLIIAARVLQWLNNPKEALLKMKKLLKPNGTISILDYNHSNLQWQPEPPESMKTYYNAFLKWRKDAGMNNEIANDLTEMMKEVGMHSIQEINSDELYERYRADFTSKVGIWSKVATLDQVVDEGYITDSERLLAIKEYDKWVADKAICMIMKLNEVRGKF